MREIYIHIHFIIIITAVAGARLLLDILRRYRIFKQFFSRMNFISGEHVQNGDHSDAHISTFSHSSKEVSVNVRIRIKNSTIYNYILLPIIYPFHTFAIALTGIAYFHFTSPL